MIEISKETLSQVFDIVVNSLDFGSGFLEDVDVRALRDVAVLLGVDPMVATPSSFRVNFPHEFVSKDVPDDHSMRAWYLTHCKYCSEDTEHLVHNTVPKEASP